jgi:hypothetical protein
MNALALAKRALEAVPARADDEALDDWASRAHRWALARPVIDRLAVALMRAAADEAVTKPADPISSPGRPTIGDRPMTGAERMQRHRESRKST